MIDGKRPILQTKCVLAFAMELALVVDQVLNRGKMECISARGPICQSAVIQLKMCTNKVKSCRRSSMPGSN
jgi:hypothetical protein